MARLTNISGPYNEVKKLVNAFKNKKISEKEFKKKTNFRWKNWSVPWPILNPSAHATTAWWKPCP